MKEVDLAYLAGMIDADGYITVARMRKRKPLPSGNVTVNTYYALKVGIGGTRTPPMELARSLFGGSITSHVPEGKALRQYQWSVSGTTGLEVLKRIAPYLRIKKGQAILGIAFQEMMLRHKQQMKHEQKPPYRITDAMQAEREAMWLEMTGLNQPTNRRKYRLDSEMPNVTS